MSWHAWGKRRFPHGLFVVGMALTSLLAACAQAPDGTDYVGDYESFDAAPVLEQTPVPEVEAGVVLAPWDAGSVVPDVPNKPPATRDAGTARDAGDGVLRPVDSGMTSVDPPTTPPVTTPTKPVDAGSVTTQPEAGASGQMCSATPAYPTSTACAKCTCMKCATQVAACFAGADSAKCASVQACAEKNHCAGEDCYCGGSLLCLNPEGKCRAEIEAAADATDPLGVQSAGNDANNPVGRAKAVGACEVANCKSECGL
jgi:hypothetical protein